MIGALAASFAAIFSGVTPVVASRAIKLIGFVRANVIRLSFAVVILGVWAFAFGQGLRGQTLLFVTAGAIGFGIGGLAFLAALPRLGAPLTSLVEETVAAPVAAVVAWFWYADKLTTNQIVFCGVILAGVVIGLMPYVRGPNLKSVTRGTVAVGVGLALLAATAQGISFAATRNGMLLMKAAHIPPDVITVAFQRLLGGFAVAIVVYVVARWVWRRQWGFAAADGTRKPILGSDAGKLTTRPLFWGGLNSLFGPILAVTGTVWAQQTMNAGQVQSIVAMAPLISVPFAFWLEGHKPPRLWYLGAAVAIVGLVLVDLNS
jgi:drug/metabolite transporter (DMT)-like permease